MDGFTLAFEALRSHCMFLTTWTCGRAQLLNYTKHRILLNFTFELNGSQGKSNHFNADQELQSESILLSTKYICKKATVVYFIGWNDCHFCDFRK